MGFTAFLAILLGINLACAVIAALVASRSGRDPFGWVLAGAALGPFGLVALLAVRGADHRPTLRVARAGVPGGGLRVLVPVDGSPQSLAAVDYAIKEGAGISRVVLLAVLARERADGVDAPAGSPRRRELEEEVESHTAEARRRLETAGLAYIAETRFGNPGDEILEVAGSGEIDEVIMGRRGRGGVGKLLLGSVSDQVVKHATVPVTVVG